MCTGSFTPTGYLAVSSSKRLSTAFTYGRKSRACKREKLQISEKRGQQPFLFEIPHDQRVSIDKTHGHFIVRLRRLTTLALWTIRTLSAATYAKDIVAVEPLRKLYESHRCSMPHRVAEVCPNIPFQIQLSNFTEDEILIPKSTNVGICDVILNELYVLSVKGDLDRNQYMIREGRAALHLKKKAEGRVVLQSQRTHSCFLTSTTRRDVKLR